MEFNISIFNAFVNNLEEAENNIKSAYLYADNVELYDYTLMMYPYIEELKKFYIKRGRFITPTDIDFMLDDVNYRLFDLTREQYELYYHESFDKIVNSTLFGLVKTNRPNIKQSMCIEDVLTSAKIDFINSNSYHMYNESDFSLGPFSPQITSKNNTTTHFANFLFAQLPAFKIATADEIIDIRKELSKYIIPFRSSLLSLAKQINVLPVSENFEEECKTIFFKDVQPKVEEIKQAIQDNNILKNLIANIFTTKATWESIGAVAIACASGNEVLSTISHAGALGLTGYSVATSLKTVNDASKDIKKNEMYFYYQTGAKLEKISQKTKQTILISQPEQNKNVIYEDSIDTKNKKADFSNLIDLLYKNFNSAFRSSDDLFKNNMYDNIFDSYNTEIQQNLDTLVNNEKHSPEKYLKRAAFFAQKKDYISALSDIQATEQFDCSDAVIADRASIYYDMKEYEKCIDDVTNLIARHKKDIILLELRARAYFSSGKLKDALSDMNKCIHISPDNARGYISRSSILNQLGEVSQAIEDISKALTLVDENIRHKLLATRVSYYMKINNWQEAINDLNTLIEQDIDNVDLYNYRSICYYNLGSFNQSVEDINRAICRLPEDQTLIFWRIQIYRKMGAIDEALNDINQLMSDEEYPIKCLHERAKILGESMQYQDAIADLSTYIDRDDTNAACYHDRGYFYAEVGELEMAIQDFSQAIKINPKPIYIQNRALTWIDLDNYSAAVNDLELLVSNGTATAESYSYLAMSYIKIGKEKEAEKSANTALSIDPHCDIAYKQLGTIMLHRKYYDEAIKMFTKAIEIYPEYIGAYKERADAYKAIGMNKDAAKDLEIANALESSI